jgi:hypothetical protein
VLYALSFAFSPAWLFPGSSDVPTGGLIAFTPLSPFLASALFTPSPTTGHKNAADAVADIAQIEASTSVVSTKALVLIFSPPFIFYSHFCRIDMVQSAEIFSLGSCSSVILHILTVCVHIVQIAIYKDSKLSHKLNTFLAQFISNLLEISK